MLPILSASPRVLLEGGDPFLLHEVPLALLVKQPEEVVAEILKEIATCISTEATTRVGTPHLYTHGLKLQFCTVKLSVFALLDGDHNGAQCHNV